VWAPQGKNLVVHLEIGFIERLGAEVLRGFGAVPKRGAEVGGVLLGSITSGSPAIVRVAEFEPVPCTYQRGPSYVLTPEESAAFSETCAKWRNRPGGGHYAVGYYRGHTRDGLSLSEEDLDLMNLHFPAPASIALLVRPQASKASVGAIFFREGGRFPESTPLEFPFRRWDLTGEEPPQQRPFTDRRMERSGPELVRSNPRENEEDEPAHDLPGPDLPFQAPPAPLRKVRRTWLPLSFLFLMFGIGLGFLVAVLAWPRLNGVQTTAADYSLGLNVVRTGENLTVRWNRLAPAIRSAQGAVLEIDDGQFSPKPQGLDMAHLDNGSLIYKNSSKTVHFKLRVSQNAQLTVEEAADWKEQ
jgi:hypothetical protein